MELAIAIAANLVVGAILLALFAWRRTQRVRLGEPDEALAIFRQHFPEAVGTGTLDADGSGALISLRNGSSVGLVHGHGRRWIARELNAGDLRSVAVDGDTITLSFADFGWPRSSIRLADPAVRASWISRLDACATQNNHSKVPPHA